MLSRLFGALFRFIAIILKVVLALLGIALLIVAWLI